MVRRGRPVQFRVWACAALAGTLPDGQQIDLVLLSRKHGKRLSISLIFHKYQEPWMRRQQLMVAWCTLRTAWRTQILAERDRRAAIKVVPIGSLGPRIGGR